MRKKLFLTFILAVLALNIIGVAQAEMIIPAADQAKERAKAPEKSPVIGDNWDLERVDFIHYAKPTGLAKPGKSVACYKLLGVKWTSNLPVVLSINPDNADGLPADEVFRAITSAAETWDNATGKELFYNFATTMLDYSAVYGMLDGKNAVDFGIYPNDGVIAVTSIWFTRRDRRIVEMDIIFNETFTWGNAYVNPLIMDLENIAVHELGHGVGLDDVYNTVCSSVTMYGYSREGDIDKRTLEAADIKGLQAMYGA